MAKKEKVVVRVVPETLFHSGQKVYVTRVRRLGLTAYANTEDESWAKLKGMFGAFVRVHRREGTLEERLNASGLEWCPESKYKGKLPIERIDKSQHTTYTLVCEKALGDSWKKAGQLVVA
jgi:hypothetical protein